MQDRLILVDEHDNPVGTASKLAAHSKNLRHRAFSIFIFSSQGEMLLQRRAKHKYHSGDLWTNTCCGHPLFGQDTLSAAKARLNHEMGLVCDLAHIGHLMYKVSFNTPNLYENEFDHIFVGVSDKNPIINPDEVSSYYWVSLEKLTSDVVVNPDKYTHWFKLLLESVGVWHGKTFLNH